MYLGCDESGRFRKRFDGMDPTTFLRALQYENEIDHVFQTRCQRLPTDEEYEAILPALFAAVDASGAGSFDTAAAGLATAIQSVTNCTAELSRELLWGCTLSLRAHQMQPALFWGWDLWTDALVRSHSHLMEPPHGTVPQGTTRRRSSLLASLASPAPAGGSIVLFHHGLIGIHEICREFCLQYRRVLNWKQHGVPDEQLVIWEMAQFATLATQYCECEVPPEFHGMFSTCPRADPQLAETDAEAIDSSADFCLAFVILHEYGHIELGHTEVLRNAASLPPQDDLHEFELAADRFALGLLEKTRRWQPSELGSICQLLSFFGRVRLMSGVSRSTRTHPSFEDRILNLLRHSSTIEMPLRERLIAEQEVLRTIAVAAPFPLVPRPGQFRR